MLIATGKFTGAGGHALRGTFTLTQQDNGVLMKTSDDFFFDGSPKPGWALFDGIPTDSSDPKVQAVAVNTNFGNLPDGIVEVRDSQIAIIPQTLNLDAYTTIFLWCYDVPFILGYGSIERIQ